MMEQCVRVDPPGSGPEKEMLAGFLDYHRATLLCKLAGLSDDQLRQPGTASGVCLLGIVKHLTDIERSWIREFFAGEDLAYLWDDNDPGRYWRIEPHETTAEVVAAYRHEVELAREIIRTASLDDLAHNPGRQELTLRWVILHVLEETARHNGHADVLREAIDGQTGE